jgi:AraC-like DNA-binding protein/quercetin dioxygenase-like cupin family protein
MPTRKHQTAEIEQVDYRPSALYPFDLEVFTVSDLKRRAREEHLRRTHRYSFHMLILVTRGKCTPVLDAEPISCRRGSLLAIEPSQAHRFGREDGWDGWMVLFRPEFLLSSQGTSEPVTDRWKSEANRLLPAHLALGNVQHDVVEAVIRQMQRDSKLQAPRQDVHALLRHQLCTLLLRLRVWYDRREAHRTIALLASQRFRRFQGTVEANFARWHQVAQYADFLGCSERSLARVTMEVVGVKAKVLIASRINLEAKRLLVHTELTVASIAERLGFAESTYFVKFFRREAGCTPGVFRHRHCAGSH